MRTRPLSTAEFERQAGAVYRSLFVIEPGHRGPDPYATPFQPSVADRRILFPISYKLEQPQFEALRTAASSVGETWCYLDATTEPEARYWRVSLEDYPAYDAIWTLENELFSPSGRWGIVISPDDHAVIGGLPAFVAALEEHFPATENPTRHFVRGPEDLADDGDYASVAEVVDAIAERSVEVPLDSAHLAGDHQVNAFIEFWKGMRTTSAPADWMPGLLEHVYGADKAARFLSDAEWHSQELPPGKRTVSLREAGSSDEVDVPGAEVLDLPGLRVIGFGAEDEESAWDLVFQRADTFDEQDVEVGLDTYAISTRDGATHYGGISGYRRRGSLLEFDFDTEAQIALDAPPTLRLRVALDADELDEIDQALREVLGSL